RGHVASAPLGREEGSDCALLKGISANAVDGVSGDHDQLAATDRLGGSVDGLVAFSLGSGVQLHGAHRASRAVRKRARPARSRWSRTSLHRPAPAKTPGALVPWTSACSAPTTPPVLSSRADRRSNTRSASSPS